MIIRDAVYNAVRQPIGEEVVIPDSSIYMLSSATIVPNYRLNTSTPTTDPNQKYQVSQLTFDRALWSANNYRFCWQNGYTTTFGSTPAELLPGNEITIRAAVYDFENNFLSAVTFNGQAQITLQDGELTWCDPIVAAGLAGSQLVMRTYSVIPDSGVRVGRRTRDNVRTRIFATSDQAAALALLSGSGFVPNTGSTSPNNYAFGPVMQVADNWDGRPCVLIVGDSIAAGQDNAEGVSWLSNALYSDVGGKMGYANIAIHGTRPSNQTGDSQYGQKAALIDSITSINGGKLPMTSIISEHGVNDAGGTDVELLQGKVQAFLDYIKSKWTAAKLIQTTYTPRVPNNASTLQTDGSIMLSTTQTPANADRWGVAEWIKTNPVPLDSHIDVREAWTGTPDGTIWFIPPWSTTLSSAANIGATSIVVNDLPPWGVVPVLSAGSSSTVESTLIPIGTVTGTGPYTVQLNKALTKNHLIGASVKATPAADGLHPEEGYTSARAQSAVEQVKSIFYNAT